VPLSQAAAADLKVAFDSKMGPLQFPLNSVLLDFIRFYCILFYYIHILDYIELYCIVCICLFCSVLFYSILFDSIQLHHTVFKGVIGGTRLDDGVTEVSARCTKSPDLPETTNAIFGQFHFNERLNSLPQNQLILHLSIGMLGPCSVLNRDTRGATAEMLVSSKPFSVSPTDKTFPPCLLPLYIATSNRLLSVNHL